MNNENNEVQESALPAEETSLDSIPVDENIDDVVDDFSEDEIPRATIHEITDDMPEELKQKLREFNEMSRIINEGLDSDDFEDGDTDTADGEDLGDDEDDDEDEEEEDDSEEETTSGKPSNSKFTDDSNVKYDDIF